MTDLVFVPVTGAQLAAGEAGSAPRRGFAPTQRMLDTFGHTPAEDEEAEHTACVVASLDAALRFGRRLVLAVRADAEPDLGPDADFGLVEVAAFGPDQIESVFADDAAGDAAWAAFAAAERDTTGDLEQTPLDAAWADQAVQDLLADHDLMWFGPGESDALVRGTGED